MVAMLTITILTMICATSLYVTSQNSTTRIQTAAWQQSLTGAESGVDLAIAALNTGTWTGWKLGTAASPPSAEPSPAPTAAPVGPPDSSHYNLLPSSSVYSLTMPGQSEGATSVTNWVTVDTGGMLPGQDTNGKQWYRIRATGQSNLVSPARVSSNKLDSNLRNTISLKFNRKASAGTTNYLGPSRTIEVIMQPLASGGWARGITLKNWISMSGSAFVDSFDSGNAFKSSTIGGIAGQYDITKRQSHGDIGSTNSASSDLRNTYVYGGLSYSGTAVKNTTNVQGTISTPFSVSIPAQSAPTWASGTYTTYTGGGANPPNSGTFTAGNQNNPVYIKVNGDLTVSSSGNPLNVVQHDNSAGNQIYIWVTGKLTTQGSGYIAQDANVKVTYYVGGDITVSGSSYNNKSGLASSLTIVGYGTSNKITDSGSGNFIGTINAPGYDATISGSGAYMGALVANTLTLSGSGGFHYDEALSSGGASSSVGNYAFASWFEDNSDKARSITY